MAEFPSMEETEKGGWTEWWPAKRKRFRECCCDCGLVHDLQFKITDGGGISFRAKRNPRATSAARRGKRYASLRDIL